MDAAPPELLNDLAKVVNNVNLVASSAFSNFEKFEHHLNQALSISRAWAELDAQGQENAMKEFHRHWSALACDTPAVKFTDLLRGLEQMSQTKNFMPALEKQRTFHFGSKDDPHGSQFFPILEEDIPVLRLLQIQAQQSPPTGRLEEKENANVSNAIWDGKAFAITEERQVRDSGITKTNLEFKDMSLVAMSPELLQKLPVDNVGLSNLAKIVALRVKRRPPEEKQRAMTPEEAEKWIVKRYMELRADKNPAIQDIRAQLPSSDLPDVCKKLVNWDLMILAKQHDLAPPFLNVWRDETEDYVIRHWLNSSNITGFLTCKISATLTPSTNIP